MTETKSGFDPIPSDRYTFTVTSAKAEEKVTKDGDPGHHIELTLHIAEGPFAKRKVWDHVYLPGAKWRLKSILQAAGLPDLANSKSLEAQASADALVGTSFSAWLESSVGTNGSPRNDLKEYTAIANGNSEAMSTESFERALDRVS